MRPNRMDDMTSYRPKRRFSPGSSWLKNLVEVGGDETLERMPYEHELEMIAQYFLSLLRREALERSKVFVQFNAVYEHGTFASCTGCACQRRQPACTGHLDAMTICCDYA